MSRVIERFLGDREVVSEVFRISTPIIVSQLGESVYSIADTFFVSKLGSISLAAVGVGSYMNFLFYSVISMFSTGALVYVSQSIGAGRRDDARLCIGELVIYSLPVALGLAALAYYIAPLLALKVSSNPSVAVLASKYFRICMAGFPVMITTWILDSSIRATGYTKYSMIAILSSISLNIALDPILIYGLLGAPRLGVAGAALATVASTAIIIPIETYYLSKLNLTPTFSRDTSRFRKSVVIGAPASAERMIFSVGTILYVSIISRCGAQALAAYKVGVSVESFIYMPGIAFMYAASALVGQKVGAGRIEEAKKMGWAVARSSLALLGLLGVIAIVFSRYLVAPFSPSKQVLELASIYMIIAGSCEPGLALSLSIAGGVRGGGNTTIPLVINALGYYIVRIIPAKILAGVYGVAGVWVAMAIDDYVRGAVFALVYWRFFEKLARRVHS